MYAVVCFYAPRTRVWWGSGHVPEMELDFARASQCPPVPLALCCVVFLTGPGGARRPARLGGHRRQPRHRRCGAHHLRWLCQGLQLCRADHLGGR